MELKGKKPVSFKLPQGGTISVRINSKSRQINLVNKGNLPLDINIGDHTKTVHKNKKLNISGRLIPNQLGNKRHPPSASKARNMGKASAKGGLPGRGGGKRFPAPTVGHPQGRVPAGPDQAER